MLFPNGPLGSTSYILGPFILQSLVCVMVSIHVWQSLTWVGLRRTSPVTSVSRNVLHFNCILKAEASCTELPLGDLVWSTIDLFIIHSLLTSGRKKKKLEAVDEQRDRILEKKLFSSLIFILIVSDSSYDLGQLI